ncbi:methyltransferase [Flavihumibacter sp. R14]|nr:methyltransferase [Flavihumibacter soli]
MKVNTDGVLLGVLCESEAPRRILDIGTGTGVVSLILAQRFSSAHITAVEIDKAAAMTARANFERSNFDSRLELIHTPVEKYYETHSPGKFDLIVSNPPFFIDCLRSDDQFKGVARHTDQLFFENLLRDSAMHLEAAGKLVLIVPVRISEFLKTSAIQFGLRLQKSIGICSFPDSAPHREILTLGFNAPQTVLSRFIIYDKPKEYSVEYRTALQDFFTIF